MKVAVGLSGGVDSAVAALLLKEQGYDVFGIFMQNWEAETDDPYCTADQDLLDAKAVAETLKIPFHTINFSKEYWNQVFQYCLDEFAANRTPNPDIWCNREIKFKVFLEHALKLSADYMATGHYARVRNVGTGQDLSTQLLKAKDLNKDQSYFLYALNQFALKHAMFPLGNLEKSEVRALAQKAGFKNAEKKDSTGICFIGERKFKDFLSEFMLAKPGNIETSEGKVIGRHDGLMFYTLGQRKGLAIGGVKDADEKAWYVLKKEVERNVLIAGQGHDHPMLYADKLIFEIATWIAEKEPCLPLQCSAKIRYRQEDQICKVEVLQENRYQVTFEKPQRAITPGQSVVLYQGNVCLGGGVIS